MMRTVRWLSGLTLLLSMGLVSWGQSVPLQIDAVKKSGAKKDVGGGRAFGGTTQTESKEKFYEIRVRSMSKTIDRVQLEYMVVKKGRGGSEQPGKYEEALISTPIGQMVTMETESVNLLETKWENSKRIVAPRLKSDTFEEELIGIVVVAKTADGKVLKEHYEPSSRKAVLAEWLEKARQHHAKVTPEGRKEDLRAKGQEERPRGRKILGRPKR